MIVHFSLKLIDFRVTNIEENAFFFISSYIRAKSLISGDMELEHGSTTSPSLTKETSDLLVITLA